MVSSQSGVIFSLSTRFIGLLTAVMTESCDCAEQTVVGAKRRSPDSTYACVT